mmetsp:Transcript_4758/g.14202  ORF Transcript_4758/g.14202 Transcript_4758/m.14202 type:complete len:208 (-) Transcript_4758:683-1306(-)
MPSLILKSGTSTASSPRSSFASSLSLFMSFPISEVVFLSSKPNSASSRVSSSLLPRRHGRKLPFSSIIWMASFSRYSNTSLISSCNVFSASCILRLLTFSSASFRLDGLAPPLLSPSVEVERESDAILALSRTPAVLNLVSLALLATLSSLSSLSTEMEMSSEGEPMVKAFFASSEILAGLGRFSGRGTRSSPVFPPPLSLIQTSFM